MHLAWHNSFKRCHSESQKLPATRAGAENQGGASGFFNNVSEVAKGLVGAVTNFGDLLDAVK